MSHWYAIRVMTRREKTAMAGLAEQGFAVFMPCETVMRKICRYQEPVNRPLFPGYLFVLCTSDHFAQIRETVGVQQFVRYFVGGEQTPVAFPFAAVIEMQTAERAGHYDRTRTRPAVYHPRKGDKVQITAGPWMAFVGKVLDTPTSRRAKVMIEGPFGKGQDIDVGHLRAA